MVPIVDIEYELEKKFVKGLRAIFENDTDFSYNDNDIDTRIIITTEYPEKDIPSKTPHIIVTNIAYQINTQSFIGNNFYRDINYMGMKNGAQEYANVIPYSLSLICLAEWALSKDLANRLVQYIGFVAHDYLSEDLGLHVDSVSKNPTSPYNQYPEKLFQTTLSVQGHYYWTGAKTLNGILTGIDKPVKNIYIKY
ncbi:MAG: hypothetical protein N2749_00715 [Clostridia bacterium]|nr:hypothetical protein [Clostridia bacterium]